MNVIVGKNLRKLRKSKSLTQEQLADSLCMSQSAYARIERGESNSWSSHINIICEVFKIIPEDLMKDEIGEDKEESNNLKASFIINQSSDELIEKYKLSIKELEKIIKKLKSTIKDYENKSIRE